jgi:hypothetical protein
VRDHHKANHKLLTESGLVQLLDQISVVYRKNIDIHTKSESMQTMELTAEFGTKLVNFLRELNEVNFTFHI